MSCFYVSSPHPWNWHFLHNIPARPINYPTISQGPLISVGEKKKGFGAKFNWFVSLKTGAQNVTSTKDIFDQYKNLSIANWVLYNRDLDDENHCFKFIIKFRKCKLYIIFYFILCIFLVRTLQFFAPQNIKRTVLKSCS